MPKQIDPTDTIAIGFQVQYAIDEGKALSFSSCLDAECSQEALNSALDKMVRAAERQQARVRIPKIKAELAKFEKQHARVAEDMFRLDQEAEVQEAAWQRDHESSGRRGNFKLSPAQTQLKANRDNSRQNAQITYERMQEEINLRKQELADLEGMVNAASSATDSYSSLQHS